MRADAPAVWQGLLHLLAWLIAACLLPTGTARATPPPDTMRIDQAQWTGPGGSSSVVRLPDGWRQRGLAAKGTGRYRLEFQLQTVPDQAWELRFDRIALSREVRLNGVVIESSLAAPGVWRHQRPLPGLIQLPAQLLRSGSNAIELTLDYGGAGGLSFAALGPRAALEPMHDLRWALNHGLPQALNLASAGLALFMLLIWAQRRGEVAIGCFGMLWLLTSLRNVAYYVEGAWVYSDAASWFFSCVHAWGASLLGWLALSFSTYAWRRYRAALLALALGWPLVAGMAIAVGEPLALRQWGYPVLTLLCLPALWLLFQAARRVPTLERLGLLVGIVAAIVAAIHDLLFLGGRVSIMSQLWQPLLMPLLMAALAWFLVRRMVSAWRRVEQINTELEALVQQRTRQLQAANEAKTRFLASASHDLRQPLHAIALLGGLLGRRVKGGLLLPAVQRLNQSVASMQSLLNGLLDMSRLELGAEQPRLAPLELCELLSRITADHSPSAAERGLQLRLRLPQQGRRRVWVSSDATLLTRVIVNLLGNALRYTQQGGVLVGLRCRSTEAWIEIWDSGIGIASEQQPRIFEEFVQLDDQRRPPGPAGLGLGLAIVKRSLASLALPLELCSQTGRGSRFRLRLPLLPTPGVATDAPAGLAPDGASTGSALFVLLVDDDEPVRYAMQALLTDLGCRVLAAAGPSEALAGLEQHLRSPDAVLLDYRLKDGTGLALLAQLREIIGPALPAALITGEFELAELRASLHGPTVLLHKPLEPLALQAWLARVAADLPRDAAGIATP